MASPTSRLRGKRRPPPIIPEVAEFISSPPKPGAFKPAELCDDTFDFEWPLGPRKKSVKEIEVEEIRKKLAYLNWRKVRCGVGISGGADGCVCGWVDGWMDGRRDDG